MGLVLWDCTTTNTGIARSDSSPPMPDTPARTTNSSLVAPSSTPKPAPPTPRAGHVRSETGRRLATFASTPSATPAATKSETPADRHRTTPLTNTGHGLIFAAERRAAVKSLPAQRARGGRVRPIEMPFPWLPTLIQKEDGLMPDARGAQR